MQDNGYKRLLFWGGAGALTLPGKPDVRLYTTPRYPPQYVSGLDRWKCFLVSQLLSRLVEHSKNHVKILEIAQKTSLDWTMLCPPMIYQVPATKVKVAKNTPTGGTAVSNYDQAEFVLDVLLDKEKGKEWFKQQVGLSSDGLSMNAPPKKDGKL
jgi:putative NADH-flavin reductase